MNDIEKQKAKKIIQGNILGSSTDDSAAVCPHCEGNYWSDVLWLMDGKVLRGKDMYLKFMNSNIWHRKPGDPDFDSLVERHYVEPCFVCHVDQDLQRVNQHGLRSNDEVVGLGTIKQYCPWNVRLANKDKYHELMAGSVLFWGATGTGKTTLARCYYNMFMYENPKKTLRWIGESSLMSGFGNLDKTKNQRGDTQDAADIFYDQLRSVDALFLDEILEPVNWQNDDGMGFLRSKAYRYYSELINYRYDNRHLITIATSMRLPDKKSVGEDHIQRRLDELFVKKIELKK